MNETQKKALTTIVVIVAAVALLYGLRWFVEKFPPQQQASQEQAVVPSASETASSPAAPSQTAPQTSTKSAQTASAYQQALAKYPNRIQFKDCRGIIQPTGLGSTVVKQGTKIMLDNRDEAAHTIAFKGVSVKVAGYNFSIVTASVLGTYNVTCDGGGSAALTVEK